MYIVYGGRSATNEHFNNKYNSVEVERFVFQNRHKTIYSTLLVVVLIGSVVYLWVR